MVLTPTVEPLAVLSWPILERIPLWGDAVVSPHGLGIAVGFVVAAYLFRHLAIVRGLRTDGVAVDVTALAQDIVVRSAVGAVVGGRLAFVATHLDQYLDGVNGLVEVLALTDGGFSFLGGVAGALALVVPWLRRQGLRTSLVLDAGAPAVALGLLCGRLGDLTIGDHLGAPTSSVLGWRCAGNLHDAATNTIARIGPRPYPDAAAPTQGCFDVALHQTALYDGLAALVVLGVTLWVARRVTRPGIVAATWVLTYAPLRIAGDVLREDRRFGALTGSQWTMLAAAGLTVAWLVRSRQPD